MLVATQQLFIFLASHIQNKLLDIVILKFFAINSWLLLKIARNLKYGSLLFLFFKEFS